jgi:selenide,water dikinase
MTEATLTPPAVPRLTSLSHGGGCGCKIAPGVLSELLKRATPPALFPICWSAPKPPTTRPSTDSTTSRRSSRPPTFHADRRRSARLRPHRRDQCAVRRHAMGGKPILALALVGMPINVLPHETIAAVLRGGEAVCAEAGIPVAGGHSIDSVEPIYGLAAIGVVHPSRVKRNAAARAGDVLVLGKPLGVGVLSAALKKNQLDAAGYAQMLATTTKLNRPGAELAALPACTR